MKKSIACLLALLLLAVPLLAWAEGETIYSIVDAQGQYITHFVGEPAQGDEYIAHDNSHYVITAVDVAAHTAQAEKKGAYPMPNVSWLSEDSRAVSSGTQRHAVALYCTHSDESYEPTDGASSITPRGSIYDVAQALKSNLEQRGVKVYYDDSTHLPHDSGAYKRSRSTAANLLENGVDAIFDIHRDGIKDPAQYETTIKGEEASMVRLLVGRANQNQAENKEFAVELKAVADKLYPELIRDIYIGKGTYNQDLSPNSVLLEFGTHTIDKERAENATQYMAAAIEKTLYGGVSGAAGEGQSAQNTKSRDHSAWISIAWIAGVLLVGACVYGVASTGSLKAGFSKVGNGFKEMTGGIFNKKNNE